MNAFDPRKASIYRPYRDEIPWDLLLLADADESRVMDYASVDSTRVAKFEDEVVGAYVVAPVNPLRFALRNLVVAPEFRNRGLGRWLLGHAIGLAESKGAREIEVPRGRLMGLFAAVGFTACEGGLLLTLTPE